MKPVITTLTLVVVLSVTGAARAQRNACDITADGRVDLLDLQTMVNVVNGGGCPRADCDLDSDRQVTVTDVQKVMDHVLGARRCQNLVDGNRLLASLSGGGFGGPQEAAVIDIDMDGDLDWFLRGVVSDTVAFVPEAFTAAFDLDGDGVIDAHGPISGFGIDPDGDDRWPFDWFSHTPNVPHAGIALLALTISCNVERIEVAKNPVLYLDLDGDRKAEHAFHITHVVGELF